MWGRSYQVGRQLCRIGMDDSQRMTNIAEAGVGMIGVASLIILFLIILAVFL